MNWEVGVILFFKLPRLLKFMSSGVMKPTENIMKNGNGKYDINTMYFSERRMEGKCMM